MQTHTTMLHVYSKDNMYSEAELDSLLNNQSPQWNYMLDFLGGIDISGSRGAEAYVETFLLPKNSTVTARKLAATKSRGKGSPNA